MKLHRFMSSDVSSVDESSYMLDAVDVADPLSTSFYMDINIIKREKIQELSSLTE